MDYKYKKILPEDVYVTASDREATEEELAHGHVHGAHDHHHDHDHDGCCGGHGHDHGHEHGGEGCCGGKGNGGCGCH